MWPFSKENPDLKWVPMTRFKKLHEKAIMPKRHYNTDAGMDVYCLEDFSIEPRGDILVDIGLSMALPENHVAFVKEKSGLAVKKKITIGACVIDENYRGEIKIHLFNNSDNFVYFDAGSPIAQLVVIPYWNGPQFWVCALDETDRGNGGFGSTGEKHSTITESKTKSRRRTSNDVIPTRPKSPPSKISKEKRDKDEDLIEIIYKFDKMMELFYELKELLNEK